MRIALIEALRPVLGFGPYVWAVTDPSSEVGVSPVADVPEAVFQDLPGLIRTRYLSTVNRWNRLERVSDSLVRATGGELRQSLLHREVLAGHDVVDVATVVFRDAHGLWGGLDLWRQAPSPPFSDQELDDLAGCAPTITAALRRCLARTFEQPAVLPPRPGPLVLVLSAELAVRAQTPQTEEYLRILLPPDPDRRPVPAAAYNVAA